jgi:hypothetical protein
MNDAADHATVIDPRLAARIIGQVRRNPRKLRLGEPKLIAIHQVSSQKP